MSRSESDAVLKRFLDFLQGDRRIRIGLGVVLVGVMLFFAGRSVYGLLPRSYTLRVTGGDIINNRHFIARMVADEGKKQNLVVVVEPTKGALESLRAVSAGEIDLAFVQGGLDQTFPNVEHVASVSPEMMHLLVKPGIKALGDLKGKTVNVGTKDSGAREVALKLMTFAGLLGNLDFIESNLSTEQLLAIPANKLPDAIFSVSTVPSHLVEQLVQKDNYVLLEIPFPEALALRFGWVASGKILAFAYDLTPPVPEKDIRTVAVNMHLVANSRVDPMAIKRFLEVLYSRSVEARIRDHLDDTKIGVSATYPISAGMIAYVDRDKSVFTPEMWNKMTNLFGAVMSSAGIFLVVVKWFKGPPPKVVFDDKEFHGFMTQVADVEKKVADMEEAGAYDVTALRAMRKTLNELRHKVLDRYRTANLKDAMVFDRCIGSVRSSHEHIGQILERQAEAA